jgi:aldehyde dehydrogenase (NAD+)
MNLKKINLLKEKSDLNILTPLNIRIKKLKKLKKNIIKYEDEIILCLKKDLDKPYFEAYSSEILFTLKEIDFAIKNIKFFLKSKKVKTPFYLFGSKSYIINEPYGLVLIISPWNYPFQLSFSPLISSYIVGNKIILKTSNKTKETSKIINKIINLTFDKNEIIHLDIKAKDVIPKLINKIKFDKIFFTGSTNVGKKIYEAAAKQLIPVTLELGGKSPCIIDKDVNINISLKRILSSKFFNLGQTCIAPDYLLVHEKIKNEVIKQSKNILKDFYGNNPLENQNLGKIINEKNFDRIKNYILKEKVIIGGKFNKKKLKIEPTLIELNNKSDVMKQEIFGPILPLIYFNNYYEVISIIKNNPEPLALYLFSNNNEAKNIFLKEKFGGGCINNAIMHISNINLPFGGIGKSGLGRYHGLYGLKTFTYKKSILSSSFFPDFNIRYPPYNKNIIKYLKRL